MIDERLVRASLKFEPSPEAFERLSRRRARKRRNKRITAGVVGMGVFVATVWLVTSGAPIDHTQVPGTPGGTSAGTRAETRVTINKGSGFRGMFFGTVESTRPFKCADDRKVVVFKRQGPEQDPRTDKKVASDTAYAVGPNYRWQAQVTNWRDQNGGWFYARVGKTESCRADTSRTRRLFIAG